MTESNGSRDPLPQAKVVMEAYAKFQALPLVQREEILVKATAHAEKSLGAFVGAIGKLNAPRADKKAVIEKLFGGALKPCGKADHKTKETLEIAQLISIAVVMNQEGLLGPKP